MTNVETKLVSAKNEAEEDELLYRRAVCTVNRNAANEMNKLE